MRSAQALAVALTWFATVTPGAPLAYTVRLDTTATPVLAGTHVRTFSQAVRRFGKPDRVAAVAGTPPVCKVSWLRYRLEIRFLTEGAGACAASALGSWWQVTTGALQWHTRLGLHVGDSAAKLAALYPGARSLDFLGLGTLRELETGGHLCDGGAPLALAARVGHGAVTALVVVHVPACG